jgi:hypothetical protein
MQMRQGLPDAWTDALRGQADWEKIFDGYNATVDYPASFFYKDIIAAYPDAKVLLSVRDGRAWARSMRSTIWTVEHDKSSPVYHLAKARACVDPASRAYVEFMVDLHREAHLFGPDPEQFDEDAAVAAMECHNAEVRAHVPADRLLEWNPADGWEPLCEFLEVPVPDAPLPRVNDSGSFISQVTAAAMGTLTNWWAAQPAPAGRP